MPASDEITKRIVDLTNELDSGVAYDDLRDFANHWTAFGLMLFALAASAIAALGGISGSLTVLFRRSAWCDCITCEHPEISGKIKLALPAKEWLEKPAAAIALRVAGNAYCR